MLTRIITIIIMLWRCTATPTSLSKTKEHREITVYATFSHPSHLPLTQALKGEIQKGSHSVDLVFLHHLKRSLTQCKAHASPQEQKVLTAGLWVSIWVAPTRNAPVNIDPESDNEHIRSDLTLIHVCGKLDSQIIAIVTYFALKKYQNISI